MLWNTRRIWLWLWLMIAMAMAGARPALAQITNQVNMSDAKSDFEYYDQVNGSGCPQDGTIASGNGAGDPNMARDQFCSTSIIRSGDKIQWNSPPVAIGVGPHGTESGTCGTTTCTGSPSDASPNWTDTLAGQQPGDPPFIVPPGSSSFTFSAAGVYPYFCTVHTVAMTGTVVVQDYTLTLSPAAQWVYTNTAATYNGTATALPNATIPANGASAAYNKSVTLTSNGSAINETNPSVGSLTPTTAGLGFTVGDSGENSPTDVTIQVNGFGSDASHLTHDSNAAALHVVQLTVGAVMPSSLTIAPTDAVGQPAKIQVTANGTFPSSVVPTCTGLPAGASCSFSPNPIVPGASAQTITMTVKTNGVVSGTYTPSFVIAPGGGLAQKSASFTMVVEDFTATLSSASTQTIPPAGTATFNGTLTPVGGYTGTVTLTCSTVPAGATCPGAGSSAPVSLSGGVSKPFTVTFVDTTFLGSTSNLNIVATGSVGPVVHNIPVTVNVGGFTLGNASTTTVADVIGNPSSSMTFQIIPTGSFNTSVTLSCTGGALPAGATCRFYPSNVIALSGASPITVTLVVTTTSATAAGSYAFNVQGLGGGSTQTISGGLTLSVTAGAASVDVSVTASPSTTPGPVQQFGKPLKFNFVVTNAPTSGAATTATVLISFSVPLAATPTFGGTSGACTGTGPYTCPVASIAINTSKTVTATFPAPFVRSMRATAQVSSPDTDTNQANNVGNTGLVQIRLIPFARKGAPAKLP